MRYAFWLLSCFMVGLSTGATTMDLVHAIPYTGLFLLHLANMVVWAVNVRTLRPSRLRA